MDAGVVEVDEVSLDLELLCEVLLKLLVQVCHHGLGRVLLIDLVSKSRRAHYCQPQVHIALLKGWTVVEVGRDVLFVTVKSNKWATY